MTKIPLRVSRLKIRHTKVKFIIIHHTVCLYPTEEIRIDNQKPQMNGLFKGVMETKTADVNYHYVIDKIGDEYIPIVGRPLAAICDFDDIDPSINKASIHVALMGSYNFKIPEARCYEILSYKILAPLMKLYNLTPNKIKFHSEVSETEEYCPGDFVDKGKIIAQTRRFIMK